MVGWHHRLDGHEFEQAPEDGEGRPDVLQSMGCTELDVTERLNNNNKTIAENSPKLLFYLHLFKSLILNNYVQITHESLMRHQAKLVIIPSNFSY